MERPLLYRELDDGCYPLLAYIAYKIIEEASWRSLSHSLRLRSYTTPQVCEATSSSIGSRTLACNNAARRRLRLRRRRPRRRRRQRHLTRVQRPSGPFRRCFTQHQRRPARLDLVATDVIRSIRLEGANAQPLRSRRAVPSFSPTTALSSASPRITTSPARRRLISVSCTCSGRVGSSSPPSAPRACATKIVSDSQCKAKLSPVLTSRTCDRARRRRRASPRRARRRSATRDVRRTVARASRASAPAPRDDDEDVDASTSDRRRSTRRVARCSRSPRRRRR